MRKKIQKLFESVIITYLCDGFNDNRRKINFVLCSPSQTCVLKCLCVFQILLLIINYPKDPGICL